jgi:hypothetical protein
MGCQSSQRHSLFLWCLKNISFKNEYDAYLAAFAGGHGAVDAIEVAPREAPFLPFPEWLPEHRIKRCRSSFHKFWPNIYF